jgi:zinc transporter ZupT
VTYEEKGVWVQTLVGVLGLLAGVIATVAGAGGGPLEEGPWIGAMLGSIGGGIVLAILLRIAVETVRPSETRRKDDRDREIARIGTASGGAVLIAGALVALVLAMLAAPHFWIAVAIYLGFAGSSLLDGVVRIAAYRRGVPTGW